MGVPDLDDSLTDARAYAKQVLRSSPWDSAKIALCAWFGGTLTVIGAVAALTNSEMLSKGDAWAAIGGCLAIGPLVYAALEFRRLHERSKALEGLVAAHKHYDVLILDARSEREQLRQQYHELLAQSTVLQAFVAGAQYRRDAIQKEEPTP